MEKLNVHLEPSNLIGSSQKGYELLKVTEQTVGLYRNVQWRTAEDVQSRSLQESSSLFSRTADNEESPLSGMQRDDELEHMEAQVFKMVDESDRSLFIDYMRTETELFLLFADWTEKQRRKLVDLQLRNSDVWSEVMKEKKSFIKELQVLTQMFHLMKTPPTVINQPLPNSGPAELSENPKVRQMTVIGAVNQANETEIAKETLISIKRRAKVGANLSSLLRATAATIRQGASEQAMFLEIIDRLTRKWNVIKVPYEQQVFQASDVNYPYRAELWVELISLPADRWAVEALEDNSLSLAPVLWEAADNAGYVPSIETADVDAWQEKRLARSFGHPFLLGPPVPVTSPFGTPPWAEIFAASKAEEEKLPEEAWGKELEPKEDLGEEGPINIIVRLTGDVGLAVQEQRVLQVHLKLLRLAGCPDLDYTATTITNTRNKSEETSAAPVTAKMKEVFKRLPMGSGLDMVHNSLEDFLTSVQRTCVERGMFAVLQSQALRALREAGVNDEETMMCVKERLKESRTVKCETLGNVLILKPVRLTPDSSMFKITSRPDLFTIPASWTIWPLSGQGKPGRERPLAYACAKANVSVRNCLSDEIKVVINDIPILMPNMKGLVATADLEARIVFQKRRCTTSCQVDDPDRHPLLKSLDDRLKWAEKMAVCWIRQQILSVMDKKDMINNVFDLYKTNIPGLRNNHAGALLINRLSSWLLTHIATSQYGDEPMDMR